MIIKDILGSFSEAIRRLPKFAKTQSKREIEGLFPEVWSCGTSTAQTQKKSSMIKPKYALVTMCNKDDEDRAIEKLKYKLEFFGWCSWNNARE